jgi:ribosome-associated toxin RatA of RatAB toxin-antitoxin module
MSAHTIVEEFIINAPIEFAYEVITDFNGYSTFISSVNACRRVRERVQYRVQPLKTGPQIKYCLNIQETRPRSMKWTLADKSVNFLENSGSWELTPLGPYQTRVKYSSRIHLKPPIPAWVTNNLQQKTLPTLLREFREEAERRYKLKQCLM